MLMFIHLEVVGNPSDS